MAEGDAGEQEAPEQSHRDPEDSRQDAVAPVFGHSEGGVAELPHSIQAVRTIWLCNDILKLHLIRNLKEHFIIAHARGHTLFNPPDLCVLQVIHTSQC